MTTLNFPHQDDNHWLMIDVGGQKKPQYPSPLEVKMLIEEAVRDIIKMADALELECGKDGDKGTKQWMAFKGFRNTIRDKYLTPNHQD